MTKPSKLADPNSPHVREALTRPCPLCDAPPGQLCRNHHDGRQLHHRIIHYRRAKFRTTT